MKKTKFIIVMLAFVAAIGLSACTSCHREDIKSCDFEECWNQDYEYMSENYGEHYIFFYWAQAKFNKNFTDEAFVDSAAITEVKTLFQLYFENGKPIPREEWDSVNNFHADAVCLEFTHDINGNVTIDTLYGHWMECAAMPQDSITMTLEEATQCLFEANKENIVLPNSNIVVMRTPICPPFPTKPYYFFGSVFGYVMVNTADGKIVFD